MSKIFYKFKNINEYTIDSIKNKYFYFSTPQQLNDPETPVETPSDDPVEETPKVQTYSITFVAGNPSGYDGPTADTLNKKPDFKNIEANLEVMFP